VILDRHVVPEHRALLNKAVFADIAVASHLGAVHHIGHGLGGLAESDRQHAGGQRVERAGMPGLLGLEEPFRLRHCFRRAHAHRFVENDPA